MRSVKLVFLSTMYIRDTEIHTGKCCAMPCTHEIPESLNSNQTFVVHCNRCSSFLCWFSVSGEDPMKTASQLVTHWIVKGHNWVKQYGCMLTSFFGRRRFTKVCISMIVSIVVCLEAYLVTCKLRLLTQSIVRSV